jgi:hypothetical protein
MDQVIVTLYLLGIMTFLFVKLYEEYKRVGATNPEDRVALYATYFVLMLFFAIFIPLWVTIDSVFFDDRLGIHPILLLAIAFTIGIKGYKIIYRKFFRKNRMTALQKKYKAYTVNRVVLYFVIFLMPISLLLLGMMLGILLTGGEILGKSIRGFIE